MSVAKVIEINARADSIEGAIEKGVAKAAQTVNDIQSVWVKETHAEVENGKVTGFRVAMKITFILQG